VFDPGGAYEASAGATVQPGIGMAEHGARARRRIACSGAPDPATVPASPECFSAASRVSKTDSDYMKRIAHEEHLRRVVRAGQDRPRPEYPNAPRQKRIGAYDLQGGRSPVLSA